MTVDPLKHVSADSSAYPLSVGLKDTLRALAELPPATDVPYVTASVDWSVDGAAPGRVRGEELKASQRRQSHDDNSHGATAGHTRRQGRTEIEHELKRAVEAHGPRGAIYDSLGADMAKITAWLDKELDPMAQGAVIVSRSAGDVFTAVSLGLPVATRLAVGPTPSLSLLAQQVEDNPPYAVLIGDQQSARVVVVTRSRPMGTLGLQGSRWPKHQKQGGAQERYQNRAENRIDAFVKDSATAAEQLMAEAGITMLVTAGDEVFYGALEKGMSKQLADRIVAKISLDVRATDGEIIAATMPVIDRVERERELRDAQRAAGEIAQHDRGAGGPIDVLNALRNGQVDTLIMNEDFQETGWADYTMDMYGLGPVPAEHPAGGDAANLVAIDFDEELVRLAILTDAQIEIVDIEVPVAAGEVPKAGAEMPRSEAAKVLDPFGGVAALLRFA